MILAKNDKILSLIDGKSEIDLDFASFMKLLEKTEVDAEILEVITGKKIGELDALEGMEALRDFFEYIGSNSQRLSDCLSNLGSVASVEKTARLQTNGG